MMDDICAIRVVLIIFRSDEHVLPIRDRFPRNMINREQTRHES